MAKCNNVFMAKCNNVFKLIEIRMIEKSTLKFLKAQGWKLDNKKVMITIFDEEPKTDEDGNEYSDIGKSVLLTEREALELSRTLIYKVSQILENKED